MPIVDLTAAQFCADPAIGQHFVAGRGAQFRMFRFDDCVVAMEPMLPFAPGNKTCREMFAIFDKVKYDEYLTPEFESLVRFDGAANRDGLFVLGGSHNYWHFLVDFVAKLSLLASFTASRIPVPPILLGRGVDRPYLDLVEAACGLMKVPAQIVVDHRPMLRFTNSYLACQSPLEPRLDFLRDMGRAIQSSSGAESPERIFLRRGNVTKRRLSNESEIEQALVGRLGFVGVNPGTMSPIEQIRMMCNAKVVVGAHGAALTNVVFGESLTQVVELYCNETRPFFKAVCEYRGIPHRYLEGINDVHDPGARRADDQDFSVDVNELLTLMDGLLHGASRH
jgi:capsular polysaccharide biosynthesis protein